MSRSTLFSAGAVLACLLTFGTWPCRAELGLADMDTLREAFSEVRSLRTHFVQEKRMKILARPLVSKGRFFFRAPADIRWEYDEPIRSVLLVAQGDARRYTLRAQVWEEDRGAGLDAMRFVLQDLSGWVSGDFDASRHFRPDLLQGPPARVVLTPRDASMERFIERVVLTLSATPGVIESVEIVEDPESITRIEFRNTELNVPFPPGFFREAP